MDPNETLKVLRALVAEVLGADRFEGNDADEVLGELAEEFDALDKWITSGGFLPQDWRPASESTASQRITKLKGIES